MNDSDDERISGHGESEPETLGAGAPEAKAIVMSGYPQDEGGNWSRPDSLLRKPFIRPTLLDCVQKVLASEGPVE